MGNLQGRQSTGTGFTGFQWINGQKTSYHLSVSVTKASGPSPTLEAQVEPCQTDPSGNPVGCSTLLLACPASWRDVTSVTVRLYANASDSSGPSSITAPPSGALTASTPSGSVYPVLGALYIGADSKTGMPLNDGSVVLGLQGSNDGRDCVVATMSGAVSP